MKIAVTVEFTHEVEGKRVSETIEALLPVGDHKTSSDEVFRRRVADRIEKELGLINVEVVKYTVFGQPMIEL